MPRYSFDAISDRDAIESEKPWEERDTPKSVHAMLERTARAHPNNRACTYQLTAGATDPAESLTWEELRQGTNRAANLFRSLGVGPTDVVAYVLPNANETILTLMGGMVAGIAAPINPLLEPEKIASILNETGAKVVVTLKAFPKTDVPQKVAEALKGAPNVETVLEVDLRRYLKPPKSWIVSLIRPKNPTAHNKRVLDLRTEMARQPAELSFEAGTEDRVCAYFHTGGTTGMPKVAQHRVSGIVYNGWLGANLLFGPEDVIMCPLPLFHVFAVNVIWMAACQSGSEVIFPTPAGYRGEGVFDNFWKLLERHGVTFLITVPTAISALMQRPVDANVDKLKTAFSGSSPLPVELFKRFEKATQVDLVEGYGLTECTCLVSINPIGGTKKIGSVGVPFPYTRVKILNEDGSECETDAVGEICVANPGVADGDTYTDPSKNADLYHMVEGERYLRTGDLGRFDPDGYLFITGRAKDLIIRGGHNIDPAVIEECLAGHEQVAFAGAIGQPDAHAGEVPCAYVELTEGASVTADELKTYARERISERAAMPRYVEVMKELPKTAVGKVFKPDLRGKAITRVYDAALEEAGSPARVAEVVEDKKRGLVAKIERNGEDDEARVGRVLGDFTRPWDWAA